jgi:cation diffusion facilitator family transporter
MSAPGPGYQLPRDKQQALHRARRIAWISILFVLSIIVVVAVVMGSSQAMKAIWVEDVVSLIPSAAFLVGATYRQREPDAQFPYGYRRAVLIAFLCGSVALSLLGLYIAGDSALKLAKREHPTIQSIHVLGHSVWLGWLMIVALIYSVIPPVVLGRIKQPLARELHDKVLYVSAMLDRGDWLAGVAGVLGIIGIALGWWWADAVAAAFISIEIIQEGYVNLRNSIAQLMNKRPSEISSKQPDRVTDRVRDAVSQLQWVEGAAVRLREDGDVLSGEVFVSPKDERDLLERVQEAKRIAQAVDWRLHDLSVVPVRHLPAA